MATFNENLFGREGQSQAFSRFGPQFQQQNDTLIRDILSRLGTQTQQGFDPIEKQAREGFSQRTIPTIAERFTSLGNNAISSPAFASQLGQAGAGFETDIAALRSQYGLQQNQQLMQLLNQLAPEQAYFGRQPGLLEGGAQGVLESLPQYLAAQQLGNQQQGQGTNWKDMIANILLGLAPAGAAFGPIGLGVGAGAAALGSGLKYFGNKNAGQNYNAYQSPLQQQLMNLGPSQQYNSPFAGKLDVNQGFQGTKLKPLGALA